MPVSRKMGQSDQTACYSAIHTIERGTASKLIEAQYVSTPSKPVFANSIQNGKLPYASSVCISEEERVQLKGGDRGPRFQKTAFSEFSAYSHIRIRSKLTERCRIMENEVRWCPSRVVKWRGGGGKLRAVINYLDIISAEVSLFTLIHFWDTLKNL